MSSSGCGKGFEDVEVGKTQGGGEKGHSNCSIPSPPPQSSTPLVVAKIALHGPHGPDDSDHRHRKEYMYEFLELLGMDRDRIIFIEDTPVGACQNTAVCCRVCQVEGRGGGGGQGRVLGSSVVFCKGCLLCPG